MSQMTGCDSFLPAVLDLCLGLVLQASFPFGLLCLMVNQSIYQKIRHVQFFLFHTFEQRVVGNFGPLGDSLFFL